MLCVCQVEVSATGRSLVKRSRTDCGVSLCDLETSSMRRPWPAKGCCARNNVHDVVYCSCTFLHGVISRRNRILQVYIHIRIGLGVATCFLITTIFRRGTYSTMQKQKTVVRFQSTYRLWAAYLSSNVVISPLVNVRIAYER